MVKGNRGTNAEIDFLSSLLSSAEEEAQLPSVSHSWPLIIFSGIIIATPFLVQQLLNTVVPLPKSVPTINNTNGNIFFRDYKYCILLYT